MTLLEALGLLYLTFLTIALVLRVINHIIWRD